MRRSARIAAPRPRAADCSAMRNVFIAASAATLALVAAVATVWPPVFWSLLIIGPLILRGVADMAQTRHGPRG
jgi:fatty acid desaturase